MHLEKSRFYSFTGYGVPKWDAPLAGAFEDVRVRGERVRGRWGALWRNLGPSDASALKSKPGDEKK